MATICQLHADLRYYLCLEPVDMRKQFQGLQGIVNAEFGRYLTQDEAFVFIGKSRKMVKILHRESNGLTMYVRKLATGRFRMPELNTDRHTCTIECGKYRYYMPSYCQTKKMKAEDFEISNSTIDGWHREVCRMLRPTKRCAAAPPMHARDSSMA